MLHRTLSAGLLLASLLFASTNAIAEPTVYFSSLDSIESAPASGGSVTTVVPALENVRRLAIAGEKVHWVRTFPSAILGADLFAAVDAIWSADLDGTNPVVILNDANAVNADAIEFDPGSGRLYFQSTPGVVRSMNPDGSDLQPVSQSTNTTISFRGVAVHEGAAPSAVPSMRGPALILLAGLLVASAAFERLRFERRGTV